MRFFILIILLCFGYLGSAQIISQFRWNTIGVSPTIADVGPNASSISSSAIVDNGGAGGTNGLNAGLPKADLNMILSTGSGTFDVDGIHVSMDYQREEGSASFFRRGSSLEIRGTANLSVIYRVSDGLGGFTSVSSGNVYGIPNDNTYRNYAFYYSPKYGYGALLVNGVEVWSNDGPDNRPMYWSGSGDITIGHAMDGSGNNNTFLDNLIIAEVENGPLPVELLSFTAKTTILDKVELNWQTASEINNEFFTLEHSVDGNSWYEIVDIPGAGSSSILLEYSYSHSNPSKGVNFYRLKQTDFDGQYEYSQIRQVSFNGSLSSARNVRIIRSENHLELTSLEPIEFVQLLDITGKLLTKEANYNQNRTKANIAYNQLESGVYILQTSTVSLRFFVQ